MHLKEESATHATFAEIPSAGDASAKLPLESDIEEHMLNHPTKERYVFESGSELLSNSSESIALWGKEVKPDCFNEWSCSKLMSHLVASYARA